MDGAPRKKTNNYKGNLYSDTRYAIIKWIEKELPQISGRVINIGAGNWKVPKQLLTTKITEYKTFDKKLYGDSKNSVDIYGDIQNMPEEWTNYWDAIICLEVIECVPDLYKAFDEMYRILKPGGVLILSAPFNYRFFGNGTGFDKHNRVFDYWRITKDGLELLCKRFDKLQIEGFGGTGNYDRFTYCAKAIK